MWVSDERGFWRFNGVTRATPVSELRQHAADHLGLTLTSTCYPNPIPDPNLNLLPLPLTRTPSPSPSPNPNQADHLGVPAERVRLRLGSEAPLDGARTAEEVQLFRRASEVVVEVD